MTAAKKPTPSTTDPLHDLVMDVCGEIHSTDPNLKQAINLSALVAKVEGVLIAAAPNIVTALQLGDQFAPAQYRPLIEATLRFIQDATRLTPVPAPPAA